MSEAVFILAIGTAVLAILFDARLAVSAAGDAAAQRPESIGVDAAGGSGASDVAGVIALPPFIFLGFLVAATVLEAIAPLSVLGASIARYAVGAGLALGGFIMIALGTRLFVA